MTPLSRDFLNLAVVAAPISRFIADCERGPPETFSPREVEFCLPEQPYSESADTIPMLLWAPQANPNLTAFMPHVQSGGYFVVDAAYQSHGYEVAQIRVSSTGDEYPINEFMVLGAGKVKRIVRSMRDHPRWQFYADGEVQPYEEVQAYSLRRIRDRLTRDAVLRYLAAWGAPVMDPAFWLPAGPSYTFGPRPEPR